jgi:hypothetical protein
MFRYIFVALMCVFAVCSKSYAYDAPEPLECIIDRCEGNLCVVETPEGTVQIPKKTHYYEGMPIVCPLWLIEPT